MTEREKYRTLGLWFASPGANYEQAIENFEKRRSTQRIEPGRAIWGSVYFQMLDFQKAMDHGRRAVELYPKNPRSRQNYALYAMYAGDLKTAEAEARTVLKEAKGQDKAYLPLVAVAFASSDLERMRGEYESMRVSGTAGASSSASWSGRPGDVRGAMDGRRKLLEAGTSADEAAKNQLARAAKLTALAEVHLALGRMPQAVRAVQDALGASREEATLVSAALVLIRADRRAEAQSIAQELGRQFQPRRRAYGAIIEGELARSAGRFVEAKDAFDRARKLADLWLGRFLLGVTYVEGHQYLSAQAELETAEKRRGEAIAVFLDDVPSFRYLAPLDRLGRAQEGCQQGQSDGGGELSKFLALRPDDLRDPLVIDARKRLAALSSR